MKTLKICIIIFAMIFSANLKSQETVTQNHFNVLKTNILSPLSIGYERGIGQHFSMGVYGLYFPSFSFGKPSDAMGYVSLADPNTFERLILWRLLPIPYCRCICT